MKDRQLQTLQLGQIIYLAPSEYHEMAVLKKKYTNCIIRQTKRIYFCNITT